MGSGDLGNVVALVCFITVILTVASVYADKKKKIRLSIRLIALSGVTLAIGFICITIDTISLIRQLT